MDRFKNILYLLNEGTEQAPETLLRAIHLAEQNQARLTVLAATPSFSSSALEQAFSKNKLDFKREVLVRERARLEKMLGALESEVITSAEVKTGKKYVEAIRLVQSGPFDLVIKEAEPVRWLDRLLGSEDMHLLRYCPCPVWLMKPGEKPNFKTVLAAVDFDDDGEQTSNDELSRLIMELSSSLSVAESASLHLVNAYDVPEAGFVGLWVEQSETFERELMEAEYRHKMSQMHQLLDQMKQRLGQEAYDYLAPQSHLVQGPPDREIPRMAKTLNADLIVIGTLARTGIEGILIGNTAENILSGVDCSVLAVKPQGFVSPIA